VRRLLIIAMALVAVLGIASSASARSRDRNHDRIPDRWERAHHLSLKVNQARKDQDRDGLNNRGEFRAQTDPRDRDTDGDGIKDGAENAGTIKSFEGGVLTITLAKGGELSGTVDDNTEIECPSTSTSAPTAHKSDDGGGDDHSGSGDTSGSDDPVGDDDGPGHDAGDDQGDDGPGHGTCDDHGDDSAKCGPEALTAGTPVHEADLNVSSDGNVWEKVELGKA
jgi:hypothetical protein